LLIGSAAIAGGVVFGYWRYRTPFDNPLLATLQDGEVALTTYLRIHRTGITIVAPRAEMGQGVHTTLAALVAEELDVALEDVQVEHGPASKAYFNQVAFEEGVPFAVTDEGALAEGVRNFTHVPAKLLGMQITGGSSSIPDAFVKMRKAGAAARMVLLAAAAKKLNVAQNTLTTSNGQVVAADGTRIPYTELAELAAEIEPPGDPELKERADWKLLGRSLPRVDMAAKCTGTAEYSIDVRLPGLLYATVRMNPQLGGELLSFDATAAGAMAGVRKIESLPGGVMVIASNTWYAMQAAKAINCTWGPAVYPTTSEAQFAAVDNAFANGYDSRFLDNGDVDDALADGADVEAEYAVPYLAHATMEPLNAVAWLHDGRLDIWAGTQAPTQAVKDSAAIAGIDAHRVHLHTTLMGGGFGRRAEADFINTAVHAATAMPGVPVKLTWSREEDTTHDTYRPLAKARFRATVANGGPLAFDLALAAPSAIASQLSRIGMSIPGPDMSIVQAAWDQPYAIANYRVTGYRAPVMTPISSWRSVGASQNGFFHECALDEIAHAAGADPLQMRLALLTHEPSRKVLEAVAEMSGWGGALPEGRGRGVAFVLSFGVPVAEVIEVAATGNGIRIIKAWAAVDVGIALDPGNIEAQVQSAINFGLSAAIMSEITLKDGVVEQSNFHNYDAIRIVQAPDIEVRILENGTKIRGIGEPGLPPAAPALANAIFAATGQRMRELPLRKHIRFA